MQKQGVGVDYVSPKVGFVPLDPRSMRYTDESIMKIYESRDFIESGLGNSLAPKDVNSDDYSAAADKAKEAINNATTNIVYGKTDLRKGKDGLATLIKEQFDLDPFSGQVFLFCGSRNDRFKALYWDKQGFWLLYKRFENSKLSCTKNQAEVKALSSEQVSWLMKGFTINPKIKDTKKIILDSRIRVIFQYT